MHVIWNISHNRFIIKHLDVFLFHFLLFCIRIIKPKLVCIPLLSLLWGIYSYLYSSLIFWLWDDLRKLCYDLILYFLLLFGVNSEYKRCGPVCEREQKITDLYKIPLWNVTDALCKTMRPFNSLRQWWRRMQCKTKEITDSQRQQRRNVLYLWGGWVEGHTKDCVRVPLKFVEVAAATDVIHIGLKWRAHQINHVVMFI